jgi:bacteriocin-like protein
MKGRAPKTTKPQKRKPGLPDHLVKARGAAKIELTEEELRKVSGGTASHLWAAQTINKAT